MKKKLLIFSVLVIIVGIAATIAIVLFAGKKPETQSTNPPPVVIPDNSDEIAQELQAAFTKATVNIGLAPESIFMSNAYAGDESKPTDVSFAEDSTASGTYFYMASSIKPLLAASYIKILEIEDLDYKIPFKFADDGKILEGIAGDIFNKINYNYDEDILLDLYILPYFEGKTSISREEVLSTLKTKPEILDFAYTLRDVIKYTLGPSSNLGPTLLRSDLALKKGISEEESTNLMENYLNKMLTDKGFEGTLVLNKSTKSKVQKTLNTSKFYEMEYLFDWLFKNEFALKSDIFDLMKESMREIGADPFKYNRRHETKSIATKSLTVKDFKIVEKSGYIGFDYEAAPGLNNLNGWDKMVQQEGKRIVFYDACSFARIYLKNGKFVQYNFSIASPVYISKDPAYEELNSDYLPTKNKISDSLEENIGAVLLKYKDDILIK